MKNLFLSACCLVLMAGQSFAQKTLPVSMDPYSGHLTYTVKKMLNAAGFQLAGAEVVSDVKQGVKNRSGELQLDSTVTFFNYDSGGMTDSLPFYKTVFTRPATGVELQVDYAFENETWAPLNRSTLTFDGLGRIVDASSELYDPISMTWIPDSQVEVFPRGSSDILLDSFFVRGWSADLNSWIPLLSVWNSYDAQDRLVTSHTLFDLFGQPLLFRDVHTYNIEGDNTLIESYLVDGGLEFLATKKDRIFHQHHLEKELAFLSDGAGGFEPQYQHIFSYTGSWKVAEEAFYNWDAANGQWWIELAVFFEYDEEDRLISKESVYSTQDGESEPSLVTYEYKEGEYLSLETDYTYDFNLENYVLSDRKYYYYQDEISGTPWEPVVARSLTVFPNPTAGTATLKLDETMSVQVFDLNGRLVQGFSSLPGNATLDLVMLPAGIYQVRAQAGREVYTGKVVKQ